MTATECERCGIPHIGACHADAVGRRIQVLSAKMTRRLARQLGDPTITRAWVDNGTDHHVIQFATWDHLHGHYDRRDGFHATRRLARADDPGHLPACYGGDGHLLWELDPFDDDGRWPIQGDTR